MEHVKLIVAGGFDKMARENREYYDELSEYCHTLGVTEQISFKKNITDEERLINYHQLIALDRGYSRMRLVYYILQKTSILE